LAKASWASKERSCSLPFNANAVITYIGFGADPSSAAWVESFCNPKIFDLTVNVANSLFPSHALFGFKLTAPDFNTALGKSLLIICVLGSIPVIYL
jgi:hypothetical protein